MNAALSNLAGFVCANLPDSVQQRRQILSDLLKILPAPHDMRERISTMLTFLESHEKQQLEFTALYPVAITHPAAFGAKKP